MGMEYHVAKHGSDAGLGTKQDPFLTINRAAAAAEAGDTVTVHEGVYREWVKPKYPGRSHWRRITYQAAEGEKVVIKGSEEVSGWENVEGTVWKVVVPNALFPEENPFDEALFGDWLLYNPGRHLGEVYMNGRSFYEAETYQQVAAPVVETEVLDRWTETTVPAHDPEQQQYTWYAEVEEQHTTIYANFHEADPNAEVTEIHVRKCCFFPETTGIDYITVRGFEMAQAATPWTPPTADQPGLIGPHWSKGWIIEDNVIHDSKCSGISLGKEISTGDNHATKRKDKPGYHYQLETVFAAEKIGWSREHVGSHVVRGNTIYDCGQNGIVGHLGCIFSEIADNHIYNIAVKREFYGHEIAGIKLHAPIDTQVLHNRIHDCSLGIWLDWQLQGTRVSRNISYRNNRDLFVEVSSGPCLVDHNIFTADYAIDNRAQGGAYVNNLIRGAMKHRKLLDRATPYHEPHSTDVKGVAVVYGGDDRWINNLFIGDGRMEDVGTAHYNGYTASLEEYIDAVQEIRERTGSDHEAFTMVDEPVCIHSNAYLHGAVPFEREEKHVQVEQDPSFRIVEEGEAVFMDMDLPEEAANLSVHVQSTHTLPRVRMVDVEFEQPDGSALFLDEDLVGKKKEGEAVAGPLAQLKAGKNRIKIWG
ncbi:right-handed parallel beta-helix repeat-containing protein [Alkalicoccus chagannorensis]|uniref:right-handed parallel beta-helix repeat-containing protein n=1 Tax=Alkalicoccus chagannorensis TaxID=427072 RepID=UPI0004082DC5|nr:right-handed parallel beta-helix repeat-containing protein [Alkalicoccus chagannorensis]